VESEIVCGLQVQGGILTNIIGGNGNVTYSLAKGNSCVMDNANSYPIGMNANSNNVNDIYSGNTNVATFNHNGNWTFPGSTGTTSIEFGQSGQSKGTCNTYFDTAGSPVYQFWAAGATAPTYQNGGTTPSGCTD
jgi:hypothetical protein